ncbi:helix-turn-helix transcriptional regulator [Saccharibacillus endophyticus]|uniref:helix-turn-helix transcriptional regulator n=1 Tax=Saccharibacillus endophyticus TaxID=2060666 RepID=UPI001E32ED6D|nr:helix-turn-helix domain-containing protein [Saccharibacillus endophyticus]
MNDEQKKELGRYIKENVIPKGMAVTEAAKLLSVGRSTLSNLLNGHTTLSVDMAAKMERAFGVDAKELMQMQTSYDKENVRTRGVASVAKTYVPPFLQLKANDIEQWASSTNTARMRLAVFLRTLVNSTGLGIQKVDFPGNDDAERPGWDGFIEAQDGTPWVPKGKSGWEFGVNADPRTKANKDYKKSLGQSTSEERAETTFVFVTTRRWPGKIAWRNEHAILNDWKDVIVLDSSDLEQWLEQSVSAQAWLANEMSIPAQGVKSLDRCWEEWIADSEPELSEVLFEEAIENFKNNTAIQSKFASKQSVIIHSDSTEEALAFLSCLFSHNNPELVSFRDQIAVFTKKDVLPNLAIKPLNMIAVITDRDVEREYATYRKNLNSIIVYPKNATNAKADLVLEPLSDQAFQKALESMGYNRDEARQLGRESGRSLTVLRRRLSKLEAIRTPQWMEDPTVSDILSTFLFAGTWNANNNADRAILSLLTNDMEYEEIEKEFGKLLILSDSPVWSIGHLRGMVSKIDTLYALNKKITWENIKCFLDIAELILDEDDPALDLPEDQQWAANIYDKTRECSSVLRENVAESVLLLAIHGNDLFEERYGHNIEYEVGKVIKKVLTPLTLRKLKAQSNELPVYAEAAPDTFLNILEKDLLSGSPELLKLMEPVPSGLFARSSRTGLLWALESIAWSPQYLRRVVRILAKLAQTKIEDNLSNKPIASLQSIFRSWMPQTTAPLELRMSALEHLAKDYPDIAWTICIQEINEVSMIGTYNYKPRWRTGANGKGEPVQHEERRAFLLKAFELTLSRNPQNVTTLGDLVACAAHIPSEYSDQIWSLIEKWSSTASDDDKSILREKIRVNAFSRRAKKKEANAIDAGSSARKIHAMLEPKNIVIRHEWLFKKQWVEESYEELEDDLIEDYRERLDKIEIMRKEALTEVLLKKGIEGIYNLASRGECASLIGDLIPDILEAKELLGFAEGILDLGPLENSQIRQSILSGFMHRVVYKNRENIVLELIKSRDLEEATELLLKAPFSKKIWDMLKLMDKRVQEQYWKKVSPTIFRGEDLDDLQYAINRLLAVGRPKAAFAHIQYDFERIPVRTLFKIVEAIILSDKSSSESYQLNQHSIAEVFKLLTQSGEFSTEQMIELEFPFIKILAYEGVGIPNLEKYIESNPEFFVHVLALAYKRADDKEDPEGWHAQDVETEVERAKVAYHLLENLSSIPGHNEKEELDPEKIKSWVQRVRELSEEVSRGDVCDNCLGKLFSKSPCGEDGVWPCEPVREAIEDIITESFSSGVMAGFYNARGVHWRGEGGDQERELSKKYDRWADLLEYHYPRIADIHRKMAKSYEFDAAHEDRSAKIKGRLIH